jgi:L-alanine-DL-glutamate epimerase-like enolase superfamily enzyme
VKIKIGESWAAHPGRDLDRMRQARAVGGDQTQLFVDANGGYGRKQAIRVMNAAAELDVRWFEETVSSDDLDGLREIRDAVTPDVAAGEYGSLAHQGSLPVPRQRRAPLKPQHVTHLRRRRTYP